MLGYILNSTPCTFKGYITIFTSEEPSSSINVMFMSQEFDKPSKNAKITKFCSGSYQFNLPEMEEDIDLRGIIGKNECPAKKI